MPRAILRRLVPIALAACSIVAMVIGLPAGSASAHNTLLTSSPADGASLPTAPTHITWQFDLAVPLETMTVTLIDATGARSVLSGSVHGAGSDTEVITPLPVLDAGPVSLRWRLVGSDGHPVTGRIDFTITGAPSTTTPSTGDSLDTTAPPPAPSEIADNGAFSTPSTVRWVLRYASYLSILAVVGILLTAALVWAEAGAHPVLRRILSSSLIVTALLAFAQVLVIASDISGRTPWASFGSIDATTTTDAGMAFMVRIVLALTMWIVLFRYRIAGLAIVGWVALPSTAPEVLVPLVRRFSRVAAACVAVLVATGVIQSIRLVGSPSALFAADHGRYLAVKVAVLAAMLGLAIVGITAAMVVSPPATSPPEAAASIPLPTPVNYML